MKKTIQIAISVNSENIKEELIAQLSLAGFDAFEERENELLAFTNEEDFNAEELGRVLVPYGLSYNKSEIEEENWNAIWESSFEPVIVGDFCAIRADFHEPFKNTRHEIIITPKMSFGTGHHATTYLMIQQMSKLDIEGKQVADFGTGTGVLAILAEKMGAKSVWAIDNDDWSIENSKENIKQNNCSKIKIEKAQGFRSAAKFDIVLANINKSIILNNADGLLFGLVEGGSILLSGLLKEDEKDVISLFESKGLKHINTAERNRWLCILLGL